MKLTVQPLVDVHQTVEEVLPGVDDGDGDKELDGGNEEVIDDLGHVHLPGSKGRLVGGCDERGVVATSESAGQQRVRFEETLGDGGSVEAKDSQKGREDSLRNADASGPDSDVVVGLADHLGRLGHCEDGAGDDLDDLLEDDVAGDLVPGNMVALGDLLGGVQPVLGEVVTDVDGVEGQGQRPVDGDGDDEGEPEVGHA